MRAANKIATAIVVAGIIIDEDFGLGHDLSSWIGIGGPILQPIKPSFLRPILRSTLCS